ncbi:MAG: DUF3482 domain-containing protein [Planctomycetota bacterium]
MGDARFAVVGHPNKGKSSIVATLAADAGVAVAPEPGTTTRSRAFPMRVDGRTLYTLIDTPGFQRARRAYAWLQAHDEGVERRPDVARKFIAAHEATDAFPDEVELLRPLMDRDHPAGVLYVVDGSVPYGPEYEAEMQVLRWTGRPSLALINPIGAADHTGAWRTALGQYFKIVRVFDAVDAAFAKRLELLRAFGQLDEAWRGPLDEAVAELEADRGRRRREAAAELASLVVGSLTLSVTRKLGPSEDPKALQPELLERFKGELRRKERRARDRVESVYDHRGVERHEAEASALDEDLFSEETWLAFGLTRKQLLLAGAGGGAAAGGALDVAAGGTSLLMGATIGAVIGGAAAWWGSGRLAEFKVLSTPLGDARLGGKLLRCGPTKNPNFPFVLLGRARLHHAVVAGRTHATRGALVVPGAGGGLPPLGDERRKGLARAFRAAGKASGDAEAAASAEAMLTDLIDTTLAEDTAGPT